MAVGTIPTNNVSFADFDTWSNQFSSDANLSLETAFSNLTPADTAPYQISTYRGDSILYGTIQSETGGSVAITGTYTATVAAGTTHTFNNAVVSDTALVLTATAVYPYTFNSWRTASGGGGTQLSTSTSITLNASNFTSTVNFYAYYTTTHLSP
jgi:hypothetical protein